MKAGARVVQEWEATGGTPEQVRAFLLGLTADDLDAVSLLACKDGHPLQDKALALLRAIYSID